MATRFDHLMQGYINGTLSASEVTEFLQLLEQSDPQLQEAVYRLLQEGKHTGLLAPAKEEEIIKRILDAANTERKGIRPLRRFYWRNIAAALLVLLMIAGGLLFLLKREDKIPALSTGHTAAVRVMPGSDRASLVLADGSVITLDTGSNRVIRQGGTAIRQQQGQLQYITAQGAGSTGFNTLTTPRGGRFRLTLPDGSNVWLNSASSLRYPTAFNGQQRVVELQGQGYFEIAGAAARPFIVKVNGMEVQVLGTHFDIMAYPDESTVNTTLLEGSVRVTKGKAAGLLHPGQQAVLVRTHDHIVVQEADTAKAIAWKNGLFLFDNMDLTAILREVARWYNVEIVYTVKPSPELYGGAISRNMDLDAVLHLLEGNGYNHLRAEGRKVVVLP